MNIRKIEISLSKPSLPLKIGRRTKILKRKKIIEYNFLVGKLTIAYSTNHRGIIESARDMQELRDKNISCSSDDIEKSLKEINSRTK